MEMGETHPLPATYQTRVLHWIIILTRCAATNSGVPFHSASKFPVRWRAHSECFRFSFCA